MPEREPPIKFEPTEPPDDVKKSAAIIFIHGLGDDAMGWEATAKQFINARKLPYMHWVIPNAMENRDAMTTAWYTPTPLYPFPSQRPELDDPEDEDGLKRSRKYIESLVEELTSQGIPESRIVVAGFSQGCAMSLLVALTSSKYAGKLGGIAGLAGYLPLADKINELREEESLGEDIGNVPMFIMRGTNDSMVPKRYFRICQEKLKELGYRDDLIEYREYQGLAHQLSAQVLQDLCSWLEKVIPPL